MSYNPSKTVYFKDKSKTFHLRITDDMESLLLILADSYNCTPSEVVRKLIRKEGIKYADEQSNINN